MSGATAPPSSLLPPPQASLVHTTETIRIRYFMDLLMAKSWPVMLVGNAGSGKSVLLGDKLESLSTDDYLVQAVPFNFYTTSAMLQGERAGEAWGAGGAGQGEAAAEGGWGQGEVKKREEQRSVLITQPGHTQPHGCPSPHSLSSCFFIPHPHPLVSLAPE